MIIIFLMAVKPWLELSSKQLCGTSAKACRSAASAESTAGDSRSEAEF